MVIVMLIIFFAFLVAMQCNNMFRKRVYNISWELIGFSDTDRSATLPTLLHYIPCYSMWLHPTRFHAIVLHASPLSTWESTIRYLLHFTPRYGTLFYYTWLDSTLHLLR